MSAKHADVEKLFKEKSPKIANKIPGFVYAYLRRIVHEDFVNQFLDKHGDKAGIAFVHASIHDYNVHLTVEGEAELPKEGRYIFASNHPLGGFDGLMLMHVIDRHYKEYKFLVNDILYNIPQLRPLFIPLNKHGKQHLDTAKMLNDALAGEGQILTFPAGLVSRRIKGTITDLEWKKNFISKAVQYKRDVIPVFISGRNTNFFYNLSNLRKLLGIKANIEMLYLMDETQKHRNKHFNMRFGQPIPWETFTGKGNYQYWANWVKQKVYALNT